MNIAALITVYNRCECTLRCLSLIKQQIKYNYNIDIFIIDGGSTDNTMDYVTSYYPDVYIKVIDGLFWNRGMWHAWEWASSIKDYDYYLWLNDDTYIVSDCIKSLLEASIKKNNSIIVGATVDSQSKTKVTYGGRVEKVLITPNGELAKVEYFNGNIVLVPNNAYKVLGNLDYYYTHSKGDIDYGKRAVKTGIDIWQVGKPLGICDEHSKIDKWCDPMVPFFKRWQYMNMPNGMPPNETFHLENKYDGFLIAAYHFCTIIIRCIFPSLWIYLGKARLSNSI